MTVRGSHGFRRNHDLHENSRFNANIARRNRPIGHYVIAGCTEHLSPTNDRLSPPFDTVHRRTGPVVCWRILWGPQPFDSVGENYPHRQAVNPSVRPVSSGFVDKLSVRLFIGPSERWVVRAMDPSRYSAGDPDRPSIGHHCPTDWSARNAGDSPTAGNFSPPPYAHRTARSQGPPTRFHGPTTRSQGSTTRSQGPTTRSQGPTIRLQGSTTRRRWGIQALQAVQNVAAFKSVYVAVKTGVSIVIPTVNSPVQRTVTRVVETTGNAQVDRTPTISLTLHEGCR